MNTPLLSYAPPEPEPVVEAQAMRDVVTLNVRGKLRDVVTLNVRGKCGYSESFMNSWRGSRLTISTAVS